MFNVSDSVADYKVSQKHNFNYIMFPIIFSFHIDKSLSLEIGSQMGFMIIGNSKSNFEPYLYPTNTKHPNKEFKSLTTDAGSYYFISEQYAPNEIFTKT